MKQEYQDQIDKYVLGQMDDTEKSAFEQEAAQNVELQEQLQQALMPGEKIDWVKIKANDIMKSAKLRNLFKSF